MIFQVKQRVQATSPKWLLIRLLAVRPVVHRLGVAERSRHGGQAGNWTVKVVNAHELVSRPALAARAPRRSEDVPFAGPAYSRVTFSRSIRALI